MRGPNVKIGFARGLRCSGKVVTCAAGAFPRSKRLLRHSDFQRVYKLGRRQFTGNMTVFFLRRPDDNRTKSDPGPLRVGFTVGKVLGEAVERNRIKRRMREAVRTSWTGIDAPIDVVFHPRKSVLTMPFPALVVEVARGLQLALQRACVSQPNQTAGESSRRK